MVESPRERLRARDASGLGSLRDGGPPVVVDRRPKGKRKQRYSKGLEDVQKFEAGVSRAVRRGGGGTARAAEKGASTYDKARRKSARKKRDGAIRDLGPNMGEALSESLREGSKIPAEVAAALDTRSSRRRVRRRIREASRAARIWQV
jgi:hypothetical protein